MIDYPQVVLFGSIFGEWREKYVIPLLDDLGVTYYNPLAKTGWTQELGAREAEMMAHCETVVMIVNKELPSFTSLAETGWAALGAAQRGQHFILQIDLDYNFELAESIRHTEEGQHHEKLMRHWTKSSRYLVYKHAKEFKLNEMHLVDDMDAVLAKLREIYEKR